MAYYPQVDIEITWQEWIHFELILCVIFHAKNLLPKIWFYYRNGVFLLLSEQKRKKSSFLTKFIV